MRRLLNLFVCLSTLLSTLTLVPSHPLEAQEQPELVEVQGRVVNKTAKGKGVADLEVRIYGYNREKVSELGRTLTKSDGSFLFSELEAEPSLIYYLMTEYEEVFYFSEAFHLIGDKPPDVELPIYETTDRDDVVTVKVHHILFEPSGDALRVREFMVFENRGNRTFVGTGKLTTNGERGVVAISLPSGASDLQFEQSSSPPAVKTVDGFVTTAKLRPGLTNLGFSYRINPTGGKFLFRKGLNTKTRSVELLYPPRGIRVTTNQPQFKNPTMDPEGRFLRLSGKDFEEGFQLAVALDLAKGKGTLKWILGLLGIFVFVAGFAFSILKGKKSSSDRSAIGEDFEGLDPSEKREALLEEIAELDLLHEEGEVDPLTYEQKRAELLEAVKALPGSTKGPHR